MTAKSETQQQRRLAWLNTKLAVVAAAIVIAVGFLIYSGMQGTVASYFVTISELEEQQTVVDGQRVRVGGHVAQGSVQIGGVGEPILFTVTDGETSVPVVYTGAIPDIFSDHTEVVIEGTYHAGGAFEADTLLTKCPSRFESAEGSA